MASLFPGAIDTFKTIPTPTTTPTNQSDASNDTLATRLQQHSDAIVAVETDVNTLNPVGIIQMYAGSTPPNSKWLICDGSTVSRTTYAALFAICGINYGQGDGTSATFSLPDLRGRVPVGAGQGTGLTTRALAANIGEENHSLSVAEIAPHNHGLNDPGHSHSASSSVTDPGHTHTYASSITISTGWLSQAGGVGNTTNTTGSSTTGVTVSTSVGSSGTGLTVQNAGSGTGHNNIQPALCINFIIRALA
jgi:microcystin-dependent protein